MSDNSVAEFNLFVQTLQMDYPHIVVPVEEVNEVLQQLEKASESISPESRPDVYLESLYWKYRVQHTKIDRGRKYDLIEDLIVKAEELNQPLYSLYGRLVEVNLGNERKYLTKLFGLMQEVAGFQKFHFLIFEELMVHVAKLSGFYIDILSDADAVERCPLFVAIYSYLSYSDLEQRLSHIDRHSLLNLYRFEQKVEGTTKHLDQFLEDSRKLFVSNNVDIPPYFENPFKEINQ